MKKLSIVLIFIFFAFLQIGLWRSKNLNIRSRAAATGNTVTVPAGGDATAIQQAVNSAKDGDTIVIPAGVYSGATADPFGPGADNRGASATCFIRIEGKKNLTLKGEGFYSMIFGEGHDSKAGVDPYTSRAGVCVINSDVTFENLHIKEFQGRCMAVYNSKVVIKNSTIDGCDAGGISMFGSSSGLFVNNIIAEHNFGGIMLWQNSLAKIYNNIFYNGGIMFFYHPNTNDQMQAEITNNIIVLYTNYAGRASITQVDWWKDQIPRLKENAIKTNIFWKGDFKCWDFELCEFPGKISADPMFVEPVTDPRGLANWANFGLREGSPAINAGTDGTNLGVSGGPCADPNASTCSSFIQSNLPSPPSSSTPTNATVPTQEIIQLSPTEVPPIETPGQYQPTVPQAISTQSPLASLLQNRLYIENKSQNKVFKIRYFVLENDVKIVEKEIGLGSNISYDFNWKCSNSNSSFAGGVLYSSSEDNFLTQKFKNISFNCGKIEILDIE